MIRDKEVLALRISSRHLPGPLVAAIRKLGHRLLGFAEFNAVYAGLPPCAAPDFSRTFLDALQVQVATAGMPLTAIPAAGPLVVIANHPFGLIDGMALDVMLLPARPDVTIMAVDWLAAIPEYRDRLIFVGMRGDGRHRGRSTRGWRQAFQWLARGHVLAVFPAGNAARLQWRGLSVSDPPWSRHVATLIRRTGASVLPVHCAGRNSWGFQLTGLLCPPLADMRLAGEIANKRGLTLHMTIGRLIPPADLSRFATDQEMIAFLRRETAALAAGP
jgi:putative hemolysin